MIDLLLIAASAAASDHLTVVGVLPALHAYEAIGTSVVLQLPMGLLWRGAGPKAKQEGTTTGGDPDCLSGADIRL